MTKEDGTENRKEKEAARAEAAAGGKAGGKKTNRSRRILRILLVGMLLTGLGIAAYPLLSELGSSLRQTRSIREYTEHVTEMPGGEQAAAWDAALEYNRRLPELPNRWAVGTDEKLAEEYNRQLNPGENGEMGFISIPKIGVNLPIRHGTDDEVLKEAVGHLAGSSLPVGSAHSDGTDFRKADFASHAVLSGHSGLPGARLFTDLDGLEVGDLFTLTILDRTLTYEVDQIRVVEPEDLSELELIPERDLCTLMTCTPYGINTHRLLVRGSRIGNEKDRSDKK